MIIAALLDIQENENFEGSIEDIMNQLVNIYGKDNLCKFTNFPAILTFEG